MKADSPVRNTLWTWLGRLVPTALPISGKERRRIVFGVALGLLVTGVLSRWLGLAPTGWLIAPLGASAVLVFGIPSSPMAHPWAVVAGNTLSALVGTGSAVLIPETQLAAPVAVAVSMVAMLCTRSLHPPGGAIALMVVLAHGAAWPFVAYPVFATSVILVLVAMVFHRMTGHSYPHQHAEEHRVSQPDAAHRFTRADLDDALRLHNELVDVAPDDLVELLEHAEAAAYQRTLGKLRCDEVMTANPLAVECGTPLDEAWALMRAHRIKALPVIDQARRIVGIVTISDFFSVVRLDGHDGLAVRLQNLLRPSAILQSQRLEVVDQIMTRQVRVVSSQRHAVEMLPLFSEAGHHHLPVIDEENRLVGVLTQSDLIKALSKVLRP